MLYKGDATVGKTSICQMLGSDGSVFPKNYNFVSPIIKVDYVFLLLFMYIKDCND